MRAGAAVEPNLSKVIAIGEMRMDLDRKLKIALDESRLLILGAQVLFGFLFQAVFQDLFRDVPPASQALQCVGLGFMLLSVCFLIAPSLYHQILFDGESRPGALAYASWFAGASSWFLARTSWVDQNAGQRSVGGSPVAAFWKFLLPRLAPRMQTSFAFRSVQTHLLCGTGYVGQR